MAAAAGVAAAPGGAGGAGQERPTFGKMAMNFVTTFMVINFISSTFFGSKDAGSSGGSSSGSGPSRDPRVHHIIGPDGSKQGRAFTALEVPPRVSPVWNRLNAETSLTVTFDAYFPDPENGITELNTTLLGLSDGQLMKRGLSFPTHYPHKSVPAYVGGKAADRVVLDNLHFSPDDAEAEQSVSLDVEECFSRNCTIVASIEYANHNLELDIERYVPIMRSILTGWEWHRENKLQNLFDEPEKDEEEAEKKRKAKEARLFQYIRPDLVLCPVVDGTNHTKQTIPDLTREQFMVLLPLTKDQTNLILAAEAAEQEDRRKQLKAARGEDDDDAEEEDGPKVVRRRAKNGKGSKKGAGDAVATKYAEELAVEAGELKKDEPGRVFKPEDPTATDSNTAVDLILYEDRYYPLFYINDFWTLKEHLLELNETTLAELRANSTEKAAATAAAAAGSEGDAGARSALTTTATSATNGKALVDFKVKYYPMTIFKFMMYTQYEQSLQTQEAWGTMAKDEKDNTKRMFIETNPWLLGVTGVVTILHLVFEYLAFKNDVQFWKGKKNFKGLSVKTVLVNCYFQMVIFLYLLDGDTSWSVVVPSGIGVLIEFWKLRKILKITPLQLMTDAERKDRLDKASAAAGVQGVFARLLVKLPVHLEFVQSYKGKTKKYDEEAIKYLTMVGVPCLTAYTIYSALYDSHKGWYSFIIRTQVRFIYFSGFAMMCPQIYINYKMKCVSALPWRTFVYKALNTFIDDLFAFIIKMPTMHRLACFRDDIVFFILLYQRWIYPVNHKLREGEEEEEDDFEEEEEAKQKAIEEEKAKTAFADRALAGLLDGANPQKQFSGSKQKADNADPAAKLRSKKED